MIVCRQGIEAAGADGEEVLSSFLQHVDEALCQQGAEEVLLVWFDDADVLLGTEPGGAEEEDSSRGERASSLRRQLLRWLGQLPPSAGVVVVAAVSDAAVTARTVPGLASVGGLERTLTLPPPSRGARAAMVGATLQQLCSEMAPLEPDELRGLAQWGASRTAGYLPGDLVRWCRRAHLRSSISADDGPASAGNSYAARLRQCLGRALLEIRPAALSHPWEVDAGPTGGGAGGWAQLAGYESVKAELTRMLSWPSEHAEAWKTLGLDAPKGVLLHGPSGCGKSAMARGLAAQFPALNLLEIRGTALFSPLVGEAEAALRDVVRRARAAAPCLLVLDELDSIAPARAAGGSEDEVGRRLLGTLLNEMDGVGHSASPGAGEGGSVIFVGCTNRPDAIDPVRIIQSRWTCARGCV